MPSSWAHIRSAVDTEGTDKPVQVNQRALIDKVGSVLLSVSTLDLPHFPSRDLSHVGNLMMETLQPPFFI